jgi:hypothetical protein
MEPDSNIRDMQANASLSFTLITRLLRLFSVARYYLIVQSRLRLSLKLETRRMSMNSVTIVTKQAADKP